MPLEGPSRATPTPLNAGLTPPRPPEATPSRTRPTTSCAFINNLLDLRLLRCALSGLFGWWGRCIGSCLGFNPHVCVNFFVGVLLLWIREAGEETTVTADKEPQLPPLHICLQQLGGAARSLTCSYSQLSGACKPMGNRSFRVPEKPYPYPDPRETGTVAFPRATVMGERPCRPPLKHGSPSPGMELLVHLHVPSGGSRPLGPEGWNPPRAHSIICLFCTSTALAVSLSSLSWHIGNSFPARLLATWGQHVWGRLSGE